MENSEKTLKSKYSQCENVRQNYLSRAWDASELTIPFLLPRNSKHDQDFYTPWQSVGARGVNNLASKLLLILFPPNSPFFKLNIDDFTLQELTQQEGMRGQVEEALGSIERSIVQSLEESATRVPYFEALLHLIVTGNVLTFEDPSGISKIYTLDQYVVKRDPVGHVNEIIVKESVSPKVLDNEILETIRREHPNDYDKYDDNIDIYTGITRSDDNTYWRVRQEVDGTIIPKSEGEYPIDKTPWRALRLHRIAHESYGRGLVEQYIGDLRSLENLSKAMVEGSSASSKVLFLVRPNGSTKEKLLAKAPNGQIISGDINDVGVLQVQKASDFRTVQEMIITITERLQSAFLLNSSVQRQAERVTAEEIRFLANELEASLGGIFSILSQELQLPLVKYRMHWLESKGKLPKLPKGVVNPTIITGFDALGRGNDVNKLRMFLQDISVLGPEKILQYLNPSDYMKRVGTGHGIDIKGLIKSEEVVQQEMQQQQQMAQQEQMLKTMGGPMINQAGQMIKEGVKTNGQAPQGNPERTE